MSFFILSDLHIVEFISISLSLSLYIYIYIYIFNQLISLVGRVFANGQCSECQSEEIQACAGKLPE